MAMAQNDDEFDVDYDNLSDSDLVKRLRKEIDKRDKTIKEQEEELTGFYNSTWEDSIVEALQEMGVDAKVARFVPDNIESVEELEEWVSENADVFGIVPAEEGQVQYDDIDREHLAMAEMMAAVAEGDIDQNVGLDLQSRIDGVSSKDELLSLLKGSQ